MYVCTKYTKECQLATKVQKAKYLIPWNVANGAKPWCIRTQHPGLSLTFSLGYSPSSRKRQELI